MFVFQAPQLRPTMLASAVAALALLSGCGRSGAGDAHASNGPPPAPEVQVAEVALQAIRPWDEFNGRIEAVEVDVAAKLAGRVAEILVNEGDFVKAGQVIARMDTRAIDAQLAQARAQVAQAEALVREQEARLALAATAERVQQAIKELDYVPNSAAANLRSQQSNLVGLILRDITDPFYTEVTAGVSEVLEQQGYLLFLTQCGHSPERLQQSIQSLSRQGVAGIIFNPVRGAAAKPLENLLGSALPLVCAARSYYRDDVDFIGPDNTHAAQQATGHGHVADEQQVFAGLAPVVVKHQRGQQRKAGQQESEQADMPAQQQRERPAGFQRDHQWQQHGTDVLGGHVGNRAVVAEDLVEARLHEELRQQDAAQQVGETGHVWIPCTRV